MLAFQAACPEHDLPLRFALGSTEALAWSPDGAGMCPTRQIVLPNISQVVFLVGTRTVLPLGKWGMGFSAACG